MCAIILVEEKMKIEHKKRNRKLVVLVIVILIVLILSVIITSLILNSLFNNNVPEVEDSADQTIISIESLTEEEKLTTQQTVDTYADVSIQGYQYVDDENGGYHAVVVTVTNKSNEKTSITVDIVAKDGEDNKLDLASVYAEGIEPNQTQAFYIFAHSKLSDEQLESANFEVYKAYIY